MSHGEQPQVNAFMPWFMGGPWVPKFGEGGPSKFQEWRNQIEAFIRAQGLNEVQRVDFVLSALEGNAKREIILLAEGERNTDVKILDALASLYGGQQSVAQLRIQFFNCKQQPGEGVGPFTLRLRELHQRWRDKEPLTAGTDDELLRTQCIMGLRHGLIKQELSRQVRRAPTSTFADTCSEAKALEQELAPEEEVQVCPTFSTPPSRPAVTPTGVEDERMSASDWQRMKDSLRTELQQELKEQLTSLGKSLVEELKGQLGQASTTQSPVTEAPFSSHWRPHSDRDSRRQRLGSAPPGQQRYQWDAQGRAICHDCGEVGHIQRFCPRRRPAQSGFRYSRSQQGQ